MDDRKLIVKGIRFELQQMRWKWTMHMMESAERRLIISRFSAKHIEGKQAPSRKKALEERWAPNDMRNRPAGNILT